MESGFPVVSACVVRVCEGGVKDPVGGGDWLLRSRCTCGVSLCG